MRKKSQSREFECGVPQGFVLRPVLYLLHTAPLADVLRYHNLQFYFFADDAQLYIDLELATNIAKIQDCL